MSYTIDGSKARLPDLLPRKLLSSRDRELEEYALFAEDLGAQVVCTSGPDLAHTFIEIARMYYATQIVLGQPARSWWEEMLRRSLVNRLLRLNTDIDIHIVPRSRDTENER